MTKAIIDYHNHYYPGSESDDPHCVSFTIMIDGVPAIRGTVDWQDDLRLAQMECIEYRLWDSVSEAVKVAYAECIKRLGDKWKIGHAQ
jgi:hypothetical protein